MVNVLLNLYNFQEDWAYEALSQVLHPDQRVCLLPLSFHEDWVKNPQDWQREFGPESQHCYELVTAFGAYGIPEEQICSVNYFLDDPQSAREKVESADVLFFTGGFPDKMMLRLAELELLDVIRQHPGVIMGASAGALIQLDQYHLTPDADYDHFQIHQGLGLLEGFEIEVHYEGSDAQQESIDWVLSQRQVPLFAIGNQGGVLLGDGDCALLGDVVPFGFDEEEA